MVKDLLGAHKEITDEYYSRGYDPEAIDEAIDIWHEMSKEDQDALAKDVMEGNPDEATKMLFEESVKKYYDIVDAEGTKKRRFAEERRQFMEENPSVKRIDDNMKSIYKQLEEKGLLTKEGDCP